MVAGASGVIGRQLVPLLMSAGHEVVGLSRSGRMSPEVEQLAAGEGRLRSLAVDALDRSAVARAVGDAAPEAVVNLVTAIPADIDPKRMVEQFAMTNRLRREGTHNLTDAAVATGVKRVIAESIAYAYDPSDAGPANEDDPLWRHPPQEFAPNLAALREREQITQEAGGMVLRLGHLYGPGTAYAADGSFVTAVRHRRVPIVGRGASVFSFSHTHDVATAILAALDKDVVGVLNVVDDDPAPTREWLPALSDLLGAPRPRKAPVALARLAAGGWGTAFMTRLRGADNARARLMLDWQPRYRSWREGFPRELGAERGSSAA
jgi:nucleoside-diphosphate-sugar epimerase